MKEDLLGDYLDHIEQAAADACAFIKGLSKEGFLADKRTQRAVVMSLVIVGEAATKIMDRFADFVDQHPDLPWRGMRGLRNLFARGYFDLDLDVVWETVNTALPELLKQLSDLHNNPLDANGSHKSETMKTT